MQIKPGQLYEHKKYLGHIYKILDYDLNGELISNGTSMQVGVVVNLSEYMDEYNCIGNELSIYDQLIELINTKYNI